MNSILELICLCEKENTSEYGCISQNFCSLLDVESVCGLNQLRLDIYAL